jgi:hypothetical protein
MTINVSLEVFNSVLPMDIGLLEYFVAIVVVCLDKSSFYSFGNFSRLQLKSFEMSRV